MIPLSPAGARPVYDSAARCSPAVEEFRELIRCRELVRQWTLRNIKLRYKRSVLGVFWTLLEPLMLLTILSLVFSTAFRFPLENFPIYLLPGLLLFDFVNRSTLQMISDTVESQNLSTRLYVPRSAFAVASALSYMVNWLIALVPMAGVMLFFGQPFTWSLLAVPAGMLLTGLLALGVGLLIATLGAFFHDVKLTYQVLLTGWFYVTPIFYPEEIVPENLQTMFRFNPLYHLVKTIRDPIYLGRSATAETWLIALVSSLCMAALGWWIFTKSRNAIDYRT